MICCFFGHRNTPGEVEPFLRRELERLIRDRGAELFYVGNHGRFDAMALRVLRDMKAAYPHIRYYVVLAYVPRPGRTAESYAPEETLLPEGIENVPPRFAIVWRNRWMARRADSVVAYVINSFTNGAAASVKYARRKNKLIINIADQMN